MSKQTNLEAVMTAKEVSEVYKVEVSTIRRACIHGRIPARKSGSTWLILRSDAKKRWEK